MKPKASAVGLLFLTHLIDFTSLSGLGRGGSGELDEGRRHEGGGSGFGECELNPNGGNHPMSNIINDQYKLNSSDRKGPRKESDV